MKVEEAEGNRQSKVPEWAREGPGLRWMGGLIWSPPLTDTVEREVGTGGDW